MSMVRQLIREHRWSLIGIYIVLVALTVFATARAQQVYHRQGKQIAQINKFRAERRKFVNEQLRHSREADLRQCHQIEQIKKQIRLTVIVSDATIDQLVGHVAGYTEADALQAHKINQDTLTRFRPRDCNKLPNPSPDGP